MTSSIPRSLTYFRDLISPTIRGCLISGRRPSHLNDREQVARNLSDIISLHVAQTAVRFDDRQTLRFRQSISNKGSYFFFLSDTSDPQAEYRVEVTVPSNWDFVFDAADVSQQHRALGGEGSKYCGPASALNQLISLADHIPELNDLGNLRTVRDKVNEIKTLAEHMNSGPTGLTAQRDFYTGLARYLGERSDGTLHAYVTYTGLWPQFLPGQECGPENVPVNLHMEEPLGTHPHSFKRLNDLCVGDLQIGWYDRETRQRSGGHAMAVSGYVEINVRHPNKHIDRTTHIPLINDPYDRVGAPRKTQLVPLWRDTERQFDHLTPESPDSIFYIDPGVVPYGDGKLAVVEQVGSTVILRQKVHEIPPSTTLPLGE